MGREKGEYIPTENISYHNLRLAIEEAGFGNNYTRLSKVLGWGKNGVSNMLREEHAVHRKKLEQIAELVNWNVASFIIPVIEQQKLPPEEEIAKHLALILAEMKTANTMLSDLTRALLKAQEGNDDGIS